MNRNATKAKKKRKGKKNTSQKRDITWMCQNIHDRYGMKSKHVGTSSVPYIALMFRCTNSKVWTSQKHHPVRTHQRHRSHHRDCEQPSTEITQTGVFQDTTEVNTAACMKLFVRMTILQYSNNTTTNAMYINSLHDESTPNKWLSHSVNYRRHSSSNIFSAPYHHGCTS